MVELALGEMILLIRNIPDKSARMHRGIGDKSASRSYELRGKKLGIVGYGNIGTQLSVVAEALGMAVFFSSQLGAFSEMGGIVGVAYKAILVAITTHIWRDQQVPTTTDGHSFEKPKKNPAMPVNKEVTQFLDQLDHPLRQQIETLRGIIVQADNRLAESIKWNGPNYSIGNEDRITMKIQPPNQIQLIFHRGVKVTEQPKQQLIKDEAGILVWRGNDRAIASFVSLSSITSVQNTLTQLVQTWLVATTD